MRDFHVVLCSHNGAPYLRDQIESIARQGGGIVRIHVHDFASRDGTRTLLETLREEIGQRLLVTFHEDAPGASASFIRALRQTVPLLSPDSMVFLADQDDVWLPEKLASIEDWLDRAELTAQEPLVLFHDVRVVDESLNLLRPSYYTGNPFQLPRDLDPTRLLMANPAIGHTMLISAPMVRAVAAWPDAERYLMHDWLAMLIASRIGKIVHIPQALSLYRQHGGNVLGAYRTGGRLVSLTRLHRFAGRVVEQALAFASASSLVGGSDLKWPVRPGFERRFRHGYRRTALALFAASLWRGPTWQRKAIGVFFALQSLTGPPVAPQSKGSNT